MRIFPADVRPAQVNRPGHPKAIGGFGTGAAFIARARGSLGGAQASQRKLESLAQAGV